MSQLVLDLKRNETRNVEANHFGEGLYLFIAFTGLSGYIGFRSGN
jgi:hypothetical protein